MLHILHSIIIIVITHSPGPIHPCLGYLNIATLYNSKILFYISSYHNVIADYDGLIEYKTELVSIIILIRINPHVDTTDLQRNIWKMTQDKGVWGRRGQALHCDPC